MRLAIKGAFFLNPAAGSRASLDMAKLRAAVEASGLELREISGGMDLQAEIRGRMKLGQRTFVAGGGDGTINHVLQPLVNTEAVLGVVPLGTLNHFARDLKIPLDWEEALAVATTGAVRQIDSARVNDRAFVNNISLGVYPEMVERRERYRSHGRFKAYRFALRWVLSHYPHVSLVFETPPHYEVVRTHIFMISVNPYDFSRVGIEAPRLRMDGGELSIYWLPRVSRLRLARILARYVAGRVSAVDGLRSIRTRSVKIQTARPVIRMGMDGEFFEMSSPLVVTVVPQSLLVRVPREGR